MSEAYWLSGVEGDSALDCATQALQQAGARSVWLDALTWLGSKTAPAEIRTITPLVIDLLPKISLFAIQDAARSLTLNETQLVLMVEATPKGCAAAVLASPKAVGLWNLNPHARLGARFRGASRRDLTRWVKLLTHTEETPTPSLSACPTALNLKGIIPLAELPAGSIARLNQLARSLVSQKAAAGLLIERFGRAWLAINVESV